MTKLTVLTNPIDKEFYTETKKIRRFFSNILRVLRLKPQMPKYGGHYAVTRSLVEGLQKIDADFNYNPQNIKDIAENVIVLAGVETLKFAIELKKQGKIKKLLAGPNIFMLPSELTNLKNFNMIDCYIHPSKYVIDWWNSLDKDFPLLQMPWYAGVDINYWRNENEVTNKNKVLIYKKTSSEDILDQCIKALRNKNCEIDFIEYGKYTKNEFKEKLHEVIFTIFLSESESQCISMFECWAHNIPTLVWNPECLCYDGVAFNNFSSAPFLSETTGTTFYAVEQIEDSINYMFENLNKFKPRIWIENYGSDQFCAKTLLNIADNIGGFC